jgi:8-oxo-dGTP diphosphatase
MQMKHYVLGFVFDMDSVFVLLIKKNKPEWQAGRWNGIGGKIENSDASPLEAMDRECMEEAGIHCDWKLRIIFTCPGGTVYVFGAWRIKLDPKQLEDEELKVFSVNDIPAEAMGNLAWMIPLCAAGVSVPICINQLHLGDVR